METEITFIIIIIIIIIVITIIIIIIIIIIVITIIIIIITIIITNIFVILLKLLLLIYSVLEDCLHHSVKAVEIPTEAREMIRGLVFACVHAGKTDLALKLMLVSFSFHFVILWEGLSISTT